MNICSRYHLCRTKLKIHDFFFHFLSLWVKRNFDQKSKKFQNKFWIQKKFWFFFKIFWKFWIGGKIYFEISKNFENFQILFWNFGIFYNFQKNFWIFAQFQNFFKFFFGISKKNDRFSKNNLISKQILLNCKKYFEILKIAKYFLKFLVDVYNDRCDELTCLTTIFTNRCKMCLALKVFCAKFILAQKHF